MVSRNTTLVPSLGMHIGPACEAGLSAGMRRERVPPQIRIHRIKIKIKRSMRIPRLFKFSTLARPSSITRNMKSECTRTRFRKIRLTRPCSESAHIPGVSYFVECRENRPVTVREMLINLQKSPITQWQGEWKSDLDSRIRIRDRIIIS